MSKLAEALEACNDGAGVPFIRIDGATDSRERLQVGMYVRHSVASSAKFGHVCNGRAVKLGRMQLLVYAELLEYIMQHEKAIASL